MLFYFPHKRTACKRHHLFCWRGVVLFFQFVITAVTAPVSFVHDQPSLTTATQQSALAGNVYESPSIKCNRDTRTAKVI